MKENRFNRFSQIVKFLQKNTICSIVPKFSSSAIWKTTTHYYNRKQQSSYGVKWKKLFPDFLMSHGTFSLTIREICLFFQGFLAYSFWKYIPIWSKMYSNTIKNYLFTGLLLWSLHFTKGEISSSTTEETLVYQTLYACQNEVLNIGCIDNYVIKVVRANYGRFSIAICNEDGRSDFSVNCHSPDSLEILKNR